MTTPSEQDWRIRLYIYQHLVEHETPPTYAQTARHFAIPDDDARQAYQRLHAAHTLFLEPGADTVRMANPLSAVPTPYRVAVNGRHLWANCAWDSLGIPAMLHADAQIEATLPAGQTVTYAISRGQLTASDDAAVVHVAVPFSQWYDNLIHT